MESLKERMAKIVPVRPSYNTGIPYPMSASEGVIVSKPTVSPVELPALVKPMIQHESFPPPVKIVTIAEPPVHVYATLQG